MRTSKKILVCILNWGLGHATRCIPIIKELKRQGAEVYLASDGRALQLLKKEFPHLATFTLPAYNISYKTGNMFLNIAPQLPKIYKAIREEKKVIQDLVRQHHFDIIISDNRFGCYRSDVYSIFITHQLRIKMPFPLLENIVEKVNQYWIKKFNICWIPDTESEPNLSGNLSHNLQGLNIQYLGFLSRMKPLSIPIRYDILIILSGPEPQRSYLEEIIIKQVLLLDKKVLIVQGKTEENKHHFLNKKTEIISFLTSKDLNEVINASKIVISRSGYSTLMDLAILNKKAIFIPTPGQTEQEYLANIFLEKGVFYCQNQKDFNLEKALKESEKFSGINLENEMESLEDVITSLLH